MDRSCRAADRHRSRWAAFGAALAVTVGSGGLLTTSATSNAGERAVFVPIAPCRLLDTRPASDNVGGRAGPIGPGEAMVAMVRGSNGNCSIPADAVGVAMNVAIIQPTSDSFLTVYPADAPRPLAANLNWVGGQPPTPNAVTARLSADGQVAFYNLAGTVHIAADINGYYVDHAHDDRYYTRAELERGPTDIGVLERLSDTELAARQWYLDRGRNAAIPTVSHLGGMAFDGSHIWVGQYGVGDGRVLRVDPATNQVVQTITGPSVPLPRELFFDGTWVWAFSGGVAARIDPRTGATTGPITIGDGSLAVMGAAFDGDSTWVALSSIPGIVLELSSTTGAVLRSVTVGSNPQDIVFDGTSLWVANANSASLSRIDPSTGVATTASLLASAPYELAFDGQYLWVKEFASLRRIDPVSGNYVGGPMAAAPGPSGLWYDGRDIWVVTNDGLQRFDRLTNTFATIDAAGSEGGVFDGTNIWYLATTPARLMKITP